MHEINLIRRCQVCWNYGKILLGFPINSPEYLSTSSNSVIICSALHYEEIRKIVSSLNGSTPVYILK